VGARRIRLCMKDLYHQDVVEMVERETRQFSVWEIREPEDPAFPAAYQILWDAFGPQGEMEREEAIRGFLRDDPMVPTPEGTFFRYFLIVARDRHGRLLGVRDGTILINPSYAPDLCVVYLSHIFMLPEARGTVLSYWLRIAPVEIAMEYLADLHKAGRIVMPAPNDPGKSFGMRIDLVAEMEYFSPSERISWQRVLFYGRGGFDVINPRHFPYMQPDFREPDLIRETGNQPIPFMMLVRRMGRERQATMPIAEASAIMRLMYDDFACFSAREHLESSLQRVLDRLAERTTRKDFVELLPLPTGPSNLKRFEAIFRHRVYRLYYKLSSPVVDEYLSGDEAKAAAEKGWFDARLAEIRAELETRPQFVYASRDRAWDDAQATEPDPEEDEVTVPRILLTRTRP